jgi:hypothetical protein
MYICVLGTFLQSINCTARNGDFSLTQVDSKVSTVRTLLLLIPTLHTYSPKTLLVSHSPPVIFLLFCFALNRTFNVVRCGTGRYGYLSI